MGIDFSAKRWDKVKETYRLWWEGKLDRPIVPVYALGRDPGRAMPNTPILSQETCADLSITPEQLIDRLDYELSCRHYVGDAFPTVSLESFGPGVIAAFLGARLDNSTGNVWFFPTKELPIEDIHLEYDPNNIWLNRTKEICTAAMNRWQGQVQIGIPDFGGAMDILATFRGTDNLLMDLYDKPEEVIRLINEIHLLWHRYYKEFNDLLQPVNPGYSDWSSIFCEKPYAIFQCDFSYMIGPNQFKDFALEELALDCKKVERSFYHLDGIGELNHLDYLLQIKELDGIQWITGEGSPPEVQWQEVYEKISAAGKKIQITQGFKTLDFLKQALGSLKGVHQIHNINIKDQTPEQIRAKLFEYGVE